MSLSKIVFSTDHNNWIENFLGKFTSGLSPIYIDKILPWLRHKTNQCNGTAHFQKLFEYLPFLLVKDNMVVKVLINIEISSFFQHKC